MPLLSVIVPVYNTAKYLHAFFDSYVSQEGRGACELILVDDGSSDGSGELCDSFASLCPEAVVVHQFNQGVSAARNLGIKCAHGSYIWFCDSDDEIEDEALGCIMNTICEVSPDILVFPITKVNEKGDVLGIIEAPRRPKGVRDGPLQCGNALYPFAHVFRKTLAVGLEFDVSLALLEDRDFLYRLCLRGAANTEVLGAPMYRYLITRKDSAVNSPSLEKTLGAVKVEYEILLSELWRGFPHPAYEYYAARILGALTDMGKHGGLVPEFKEFRSQLLRFDEYSNSLSGKNRLKYLMVRMCPAAYRFVCKAAVLVGAASRQAQLDVY